MITSHVLLRIIALLQTPGSDPEGIMTGIMKAWTWNASSASGMNAAYALADCSWVLPQKETAWDKNKEIWIMSM